MNSGDAYIKREETKWTFGTASVQRVVALEEGKLLLKSLRGKAGHELAGGTAPREEFSALVGDGAERLSSASGGWALLDAKEAKLKQGELQLDLTLERQGLRVTKSYVIYPQSSIIREWATFANAGKAPLKVSDPGFLSLAVVSDPASLDFNWMTGGENNPGSWVLKTEHLKPGKPRKFDSYEAMPVDATKFPGDGINAKIMVGEKQIWPAQGWQYIPNATVRVPFDVTADIAAGDKLVFQVNMNGNIGWDTTAFDPTVAYEGGETHVASAEFSGEQGKNGWQYQYIENGQFVDLVYYPDPKQWRKAKDNPTGTPFVGVGDQHPDANQDSVRVWTAPKAGHVRITGSACNTGNGTSMNYGFRMGSSTYAPWYSLYRQDTKDGLFIGWDYFGHWGSTFDVQPDGSVAARLHVAGHKQTLAPGQSLTTPKAFIGLYREDLDNAGNECLDWQYRYLWDYTREKDGWFPAIRMLGYWMNGTGWGQAGVGWTGGKPDQDSAFRKIFRVADLMQSVGADVYHRDWGWWDRAGDWNGPDFRTTGEYLRKHGMGQLIYAFIYTIDAESKVAREHPEWVLGGTLDMSKPEVVAHLKKQLDIFAERWGDFEWRNDSTPTCPNGADDTPLLGQDQGFREILRSFLDKHPHCAFQAVNGGGNNAGYDYARYASTVSFSDGAVGIIRNYWASLVLPPDKTSDIPDIWNPDQYDKAIWRGLLCINFDMTGDTWNRDKVEGLRQLIDIYHYLHKQGVVGRWVRVYRPVVEGDDPTMYFQRLSGDAKRGIIIPKHPAPAAVTIKPKGLIPGEEYIVSFQESKATEKRGGAELMANGITIAKMEPGELIYLNLPLHPGSQLDRTPPAPPTDITKRRARNMGYPGVELSWKPGADDNWVSGYEVFRNGALIEVVAHGTYYFDHSAGADIAAEYTLRTMDGAGNDSALATAKGPAAEPAQVIDAALDAGMGFVGDWRHDKDLLLAHNGTLAVSNAKGATATVAVDGKRVLVFAKLGADCGKAAISIDGGPAEVVDTYSADDIWGVCVFEKELAAAGKHTVTVTVVGEKGPRGKDTFVNLDGARAESH